MSDVSRIDTYGAKLVLLPYMLAIIGSCLYTIILGVYNGDFIQRDVLFPLPALLVIAVLTINGIGLKRQKMYPISSRLR